MILYNHVMQWIIKYRGKFSCRNEHVWFFRTWLEMENHPLDFTRSYQSIFVQNQLQRRVEKTVKQYDLKYSNCQLTPDNLDYHAKTFETSKLFISTLPTASLRLCSIWTRPKTFYQFKNFLKGKVKPKRGFTKWQLN